MQEAQTQPNPEQNNPLLTQPLGKLLPAFAVPCVISLLISCLYNIVD